MRSTTAPKPVTTPIPVPLSAPECETFLLPYLAMPKRGPPCTRGSSRVCNLILWVLSTGMHWKGLPVPTDANGTPAMHETTVYKVFATWADAGALWPAFLARVRPLAAETQRDTRVLHGDGTTPVAKKGAMGLATRAPTLRRGSKASPASPIRATSAPRSPGRRSMKPTWSCSRRA